MLIFRIPVARTAVRPPSSSSSSSQFYSTIMSLIGERKTYSALGGGGIMINYIIGTGVFALPSAFYAAGSLLSSACLITFAILSTICLTYTVESMERAGGVNQYNMINNKSKQIQYNEQDSLLSSTTSDRNAVSLHSTIPALSQPPSSSTQPPITYQPNFGTTKLDSLR